MLRMIQLAVACATLLATAEQLRAGPITMIDQQSPATTGAAGVGTLTFGQSFTPALNRIDAATPVPATLATLGVRRLTPVRRTCLTDTGYVTSGSRGQKSVRLQSVLRPAAAVRPSLGSSSETGTMAVSGFTPMGRQCFS